jgi:hypothetical protein
MTFKILSYVKGTYAPNEFCKRDALGATFVTQATGKTGPGLLPDIGRVGPFFNSPFGHKTRRKIPVHLSQGTGSRAFPALHTMENLIFLNKLV